MMSDWIIHHGESTDRDKLGAKAASLATLDEFNVPPWFVITPEACDASLTDAARAEVTRLIEEAASALVEGGGCLAVRSSAVCEDGAEHSYAGQFESYLNVPPADVFSAVEQVWASAAGDRVTAYQRERGAKKEPVRIAVLVQRMLDPVVAGVAFGADPVTGDEKTVVIGAVAGCGEALVSGQETGETLHVDERGNVSSRVTPETVSGPLVDDELAGSVADLVRAVGRERGAHQDIEWAWAENRLFLLQSRPITTRTITGETAIWDCSNIAESYSGVTSPLTFSFARRAYEEVYRTFCALLGVPQQVIDENDQVFRHMLGSLNGRVYYNLLNWYRLVAMLPGYSVNAEFMEQMMGVQSALPEDVRTSLQRDLSLRASSRAVDLLRLGRSVLSLAWAHVTLSGRIRRFDSRLEQALAEKGTPLETMTAEELVAEYRRLERQLLPRWDAPILNDFFTMIYFGLLRSQCRRISGQEGEALENDLLCGVGDVISTQPAARIRQMAELIAGRHSGGGDLAQVLTDGEPESALGRLEADSELGEMLRSYLDDFGERCLQELKLESPTLYDDPTPLLRSIGAMARRIMDGTEPEKAREADVTTQAEDRVRNAYRARPDRRLLFFGLLRRTRRRVRDRENLRFARTRVFGRVRRIFVQLGRRLADTGLLAEPRDVFFLEVEEALGVVTGVATTTNLPELVEVRKSQFQEQCRMPALPARFQTHGPVNPVRAVTLPEERKEESADDSRRRGIGCCPGLVRGRARVIRSPIGVELAPGDIIIAERTDPGWVLLFPAAAAIVVEHGSVLSHASIVARELGVPCVVSVPGLLDWVEDGEQIEIDGASGAVRRLEGTSQ